MNKKKPRLLLILNDAPFFVSHRLSIAQAAKASGFEVHIAVPFAKEPVEKIRSEGLNHHHIPLRRGTRNPFADIRLIQAIWRTVRRVKPEIVHAVTMKPVLYGGLVARVSNVPAVIHAITGLGYLFLTQGFAAKLQRTFIMQLYKLSLGHPNCLTIFQNPDDRQLFLDKALVTKKNIVMIKGCGIDLDIFRPTPEPPGITTVMFPARILGDKGIHEFVAAARRIKRLGIEARFVLVGRTDPDNPTDVGRETIQEWIDQEILEWWGFSNNMPQTLAKAHLVCMPSYREGLPRVLIEAAATSRAIVTTDVPGCREIVKHGENGLLVPVRNTVATADAMLRLIGDHKLRQQMGQKGRQIVISSFSVEDFVEKSLSTYKSALAEIGFAWPSSCSPRY